MNERIKELAEQCNHNYSEHNIDLEKFANLIIDECIACGSWVGTVNTTLAKPMAIAITIRHRINKRFGRE